MSAFLSSALVTEHSWDHWKLPWSNLSRNQHCRPHRPHQRLPLWQEFTKPAPSAAPYSCIFQEFLPYLPGSCLTEHEAELPEPNSSFPSAVYCTHAVYTYIYQPQSPSSPHPTLPHCVHMPIPYTCISILALNIGSSVPVFWIPHIYVNICFSLSDLFHSI